jgi:hypothetical protein
MDILTKTGQWFRQTGAALKQRFWPLNSERVGILGALVGGALLLVVVGYWLWARLTGTVTLSNDQLATVLIFTLIATVISGVIGLAASVLNLRNWRVLPQDLRQKPRPRLDRTIATTGALVTVIVALIFGLAVVRPKLSLALFAQNLQDVCATPLTQASNDLQGANTAAQQSALSNQDFAAAMTKYAGILKQDSAQLETNLPKVQHLKAPNAHYQGMVTACATEYEALTAFLGNKNSVTLPSILPAPLGGMQLSAQGLLQTTAELAQGSIAGVPAIPAFLLSPMISGILNMTQTTCDATCQQLKDDGVGLQTDIFAPFKPQTVAIP